MVSLVSASSPLLGRSAELAHLHARRREASAGRGGIVLVSGEAGVGKTRLLLQFRKELERLRVRVGGSQCLEFAKRPYALALDALADVQGSAPPLKPAASRDVQFESIVEAFLRAATSRAVVAFIEDIHWADPASVDLLWTVAREAAKARLLIVASYREEVIREAHPLFGAIARIERLSGASALRLAPLPDADLRALIDDTVRKAAVDVPYETRLTVARLSEGNPLFAGELLKTALERQSAGASGSTLPTTIRAAVLERLRPLAAADQEILAQAAVIGRRFTVDLLEAMVGASRLAILEALRRAWTLGLVEEDGPEAFTFHHALTREAIYESFLAAQVREFHARIVTAIEAQSAERRSIQELAYHAWAAGDRERALRYGEEAGDGANALFAYDEAARLWGYSLDSIDRRSAKAGRLLLKIGMAHGKNGAKQRARALILEACGACNAAGDLEGECEATIEYAASLYAAKDPNDLTVLQAFRERLVRDDYKLLRVRVDLAMAQIMALESRGDAAALLDSITGDLPRSDHFRMTVYHNTRALLAARVCDVDGYLAAVESAVQAARAAGEPNYEMVMISNAARAMCDFGRFEEADRWFAQSEAFARKHKLPSHAAFVLATRARRKMLGGDLAGARADVLEAFVTAPEYEIARPFRAATGTIVGMLLDDRPLLEKSFEQQLIGLGSPLQIAAAFAMRLAVLGRGDEAIALLRAGLADANDSRAPFDLFLTAARMLDPDEAETVRERLVAFAGRQSDVVYKATLPLFDAILSWRRGDLSSAQDRAGVAAAAFRELGYPLFEADALEIAGDLEGAAAIRETTGVARSRRARADAAADVRRGVHADGLLTPRELEVLRLAGEGLSNAEMAERMSVSMKTIEKHLGAIYEKLGFNSRSKLLAYLYANPAITR